MNIPDSRFITQQLIDYLRQHADVYETFDETTDLIENGILDSLLVTDLVLFAQTAFAVDLTARDISPENLSSVQRITELVRDKLVRLDRAA